MNILKKDFQAAWIVSLFFYSALTIAQPRQKITDFSGKWGGHFTFCYYNKKNKAKDIMHNKKIYILEQKGNVVTGVWFDKFGFGGKLQGNVQKNKLITKECFENRFGGTEDEEVTCPNYNFEGYFVKRENKIIKYEYGGKAGYEKTWDIPFYIKLKKGQKIPIKRLGKCKPY